MTNEITNRQGTLRSAGNRAIDVRPKNWLTPVVLVTLREKGSHGYELMERIARFGFEAINPVADLQRVRTRLPGVLADGRWRGVFGLVGGGVREIPTDSGLFLPSPQCMRRVSVEEHVLLS
jgi:hypothetical protein